MYSGFLQEPTLIALAYDLEQEMQARTPPRFQGAVPPEPPDAKLCDPASSLAAQASSIRNLPMWWHLGTSRLILGTL
jgi:hypothetical protein